MTGSDPRRIALLADGGRVDLAVPPDGVLLDALRAAGIDFDARRHVVFGRGSKVTPLDTVVADLDDGCLLTVADFSGRGEGDRKRSRRLEAAIPGALTCLLVVVGLLTLVVAAGAMDLAAEWRGALAGALGLAACGVAIVGARRAGGDAFVRTSTLAATVALGFAAGALALPADFERAGLVRVIAGCAAAAVCAAIAATATLDPLLRGVGGTVCLLLAGAGLIAGLVAIAGGDLRAGACVILGATPLLHRGLASALVNMPEGYFIQYERFMTNRWTVRGSIPESHDTVHAIEVRGAMDVAAARLRAGTVTVCVMAVVTAPAALVGWADATLLAQFGAGAVVVFVALTFALAPRRSTTPLLRWAPRLATGGVLLGAGMTFSASVGLAAAGAVAGGLLVLAVVMIALLVPTTRGWRSLSASRFADGIESIAVVLALPAAMIDANVPDLVRGMMAG